MRALDRPLTNTKGMLSTASTSASGNDVSLRRRMSRSAPSSRLSAMAAWAPATEATGPITMPPPSGGGGLYFIVGALVVAVLVGAYFMFGAPGLHSNVARAPDRNVNVTVEQPRTPAQPAPANPA